MRVRILFDVITADISRFLQNLRHAEIHPRVQHIDALEVNTVRVSDPGEHIRGRIGNPHIIAPFLPARLDHARNFPLEG